MSYPNSETNTPLHAYVSKKKKAADMKSTAYSFTLVSIAGIIFVILFLTGVLPFETPIHTKILTSVVMGVTFLAFLIIGIRSFMAIKSLSIAAEKEEQQLAEIVAWFCTAYPKETFVQPADEADENQMYFSRYERMRDLILEKYGDLEESFLDHIIEILYEKYYQKEI